MVRNLGSICSALSRRWMPHPFVFALLLTLITFVLGLTLGEGTYRELIQSWYDGFFNRGLWVFGLQMALILVTGHALAETALVRRFLGKISGTVRGTASACVLTSLVAMGAGLLNWGLGLIVGALLARSVAIHAKARKIRIHYPLVVASGYTGLLVWHGGLSGSAPVSIATPGHPLEAALGVVPIQQTLLSPLNVAVTAYLLILVPVLLALMAPRAGDPVEEAAISADSRAPVQALPSSPAERLNASGVLVWLAAALGFAFLIPYFAAEGWGGVNLNSMIFVFLILGLLLHGSSARYAASIDEAAGGAGGILLQFPFYFGIMGLMSGAGLVAKLAGGFVELTETLAGLGVSPEAAYLNLTFISGGLVNLFVPSGGGQWAVQGPIAVEAAGRLNLELPKVVMALAYGDELTNMIQPFWALPLLAITRLHAGKIIGYTVLLMLLLIPGWMALLALFG